MVRLTALLVATALTGCATVQPKAQLPYEKYEDFAWGIVGTRKCVEQGDLTVETGSLASTYIRNNLETWQYSEALMSRAVNRVESGPSPLRSYCVSVAMNTADMANKIQRHNAAVAAEQKGWADLVKSTQPNKPVLCNRLGNMVACQ